MTYCCPWEQPGHLFPLPVLAVAESRAGLAGFCRSLLSWRPLWPQSMSSASVLPLQAGLLVTLLRVGVCQRTYTVCCLSQWRLSRSAKGPCICSGPPLAPVHPAFSLSLPWGPHRTLLGPERPCGFAASPSWKGGQYPWTQSHGETPRLGLLQESCEVGGLLPSCLHQQVLCSPVAGLDSRAAWALD